MSALSPKLFCNHQELKRLLTAFCCTQKTTDGHLFIFPLQGQGLNLRKSLGLPSLPQVSKVSARVTSFLGSCYSYNSIEEVVGTCGRDLISTLTLGQSLQHPLGCGPLKPARLLTRQCAGALRMQKAPNSRAAQSTRNRALV